MIPKRRSRSTCIVGANSISNITVAKNDAMRKTDVAQMAIKSRELHWRSNPSDTGDLDVGSYQTVRDKVLYRPRLVNDQLAC